MSNPQIQTDLKEILNKFDQKLDKLDGKIDKLSDDFDHKLEQLDNKINLLSNGVTDINLRLTKVETKLDSEFSASKEDIKEIKGSQKAQIWTLIGVLITAVAGFLVAVGRSIFFNP